MRDEFIEKSYNRTPSVESIEPPKKVQPRYKEVKIRKSMQRTLRLLEQQKEKAELTKSLRASLISAQLEEWGCKSPRGGATLQDKHRNSEMKAKEIDFMGINL